MPTPRRIQKTSQSRVFTIDGGANPNIQPRYQGFARATTLTQTIGDATPIYTPSDEAYEQFITNDIILGASGLPTLPLEFYATMSLSDILDMAKRRCVVDVQVHFGACANPSDFDNGWQKIGVLEGGYFTGDYTAGDLGALGPDQNAAVMENVTATGREWYELKQVLATTVADTLVTDEVIKVLICDAQRCAECGIASKGCDVIFAVVRDSSGSPGLPPKVIYSKDGGSTFGISPIISMALNEMPTDAACFGNKLVVISGGTNDRIHWAYIADVIAGTANWQAVSTGIVAAGSPNSIEVYDTNTGWIGGDGGYIYSVSDPALGVRAVQTSGGLTTQAIMDINAFSRDTVVAVGNSNVVLVTRNGGSTWSLKTGPAVGVNLRAVAARGENNWIVVTENGRIYYTTDGGTTWVEVAFVGQGTGVNYDISFSSATVGWIARKGSTGRGEVLQSINGGYTWVALPRNNLGLIPSAIGYTTIATCPDDKNLAYAGGLALDGNDGVWAKFN